MRIKKGFTLAEVLIVLMVIGAIATMTIPSLMKGITETQWKTAYKKAYNAVVNLCAMERISGSLPSSNNAAGVLKMFDSLQNNLSIKDYYAMDAETALSDGKIIAASDLKAGISYTDSNGIKISTGGTDQVTYANTATITPWINTDDGLSYAVVAGDGCETKAKIDEATTYDETMNAACVVVVVDVNGINKGPNTIETQMTTHYTDSAAMKTLTGDRYYIFVGKDGATAGSKKALVTGRIVADLK